jgi:hypothetical protein
MAYVITQRRCDDADCAREELSDRPSSPNILARTVLSQDGLPVNPTSTVFAVRRSPFPAPRPVIDSVPMVSRTHGLGV